MSEVRGRAVRRVPVDEALAAIPDGGRVYVAPGCGVPLGLVTAMAEQHQRWRSLEVLTGYLFEPLPVFDYAGQPFSFVSFHPTPALRGLPDGAPLDVVPTRYGDHPFLFGARTPWAIDAVLVQTTVPDEHGRCSLGVSVGTTIEAVRAAPLVIGQVNPRLPYTFGDGELRTDDFDFLVDMEWALVECPPVAPTATDEAIGRNIAAVVPDGATLHTGVGRIPEAALQALDNHSDLSLHTGTFTAGCRRLVERGVVTNRRKRSDTGVSVTGEVVGDAELFAWVDGNPALRLVGAGRSHHASVLACLPEFVSINSALEVALDGAVNAEFVGDNRISAPGGILDFAYGALAAAGGVSVVALPSTTSRGQSRIVASLHHTGTTVPASLADIVVTEYGVARLRGRTLAERAAALIAIAGPAHRDVLRPG